MNRIKGWAFGLLGMSRSDFYLCRPVEFFEAWKAFNECRDAERRHLGELVRGATLRLFNTQIRKGKQISDPAKFWPMPWDETERNRALNEIKNLTAEQRSKKINEFLKNIGEDNGNVTEPKD